MVKKILFKMRELTGSFAVISVSTILPISAVSQPLVSFGVLDSPCPHERCLEICHYELNNSILAPLTVKTIFDNTGEEVMVRVLTQIDLSMGSFWIKFVRLSQLQLFLRLII